MTPQANILYLGKGMHAICVSLFALRLLLLPTLARIDLVPLSYFVENESGDAAT